MNVIIIGAGKIGSTIAKLLYHDKEYDVTLASRNEKTLLTLQKKTPFNIKQIDVIDTKNISTLLKEYDAVVSALSFYYNPIIAQAALEAGINYFDLTEDIKTTKAIDAISKKAGPNQIFMPQCGLAPGFIGILGYGLSKKFDKLRSVKMRVGALPIYPTNQLKYNLTWSTDGLINEYCNPCETIHQGKFKTVLPLEGMEHFSLDGIEYEAFNTSGGLGTLCKTFENKVQDLSYKTVRYKGHRFLMDFLLNGLHFRNSTDELKEILESSIPYSAQDVVLIFCSVSGWIDDKLEQHSYARKIYHTEFHGEELSAIQITTASGLCAALDLLRVGKLPKSGYVRQEDVNLDDFLANRFSSIYENAQDCGTIMEATI